MSSSDGCADVAKPSTSAPASADDVAAALVEVRAVIESERLRLSITPGRLGSAYVVGKAVGRGKFATVYRATRREDGCTVALKQIALFDVMDRRGRERCLKEIRLVQLLDHPRIIRYIDGFIDGAQLVLVFEYAGAGDLKRQLKKARERAARFEEALVWKYFSQIADAVAYMHSRRILHRDLKPANVLLTLSGEVKVGDLGLGRLLGEHTVAAHSKVGTPLYMAPEALRGGGIDYAADVWSLGCILYELAMTLSPFKTPGLSLAALFEKITAGAYAPVSEIYSAELRGLVRGMLTLDPTGRPSMAQVAATAERMHGLTSRSKSSVPAAPPITPASVRFRGPPREEVIALAETAPCVAGAALRDRLILLGFFKDTASDTPARTSAQIVARSAAAANSCFALPRGPISAQFEAFCFVASWLAGLPGNVVSYTAAAASFDDGNARVAVAAMLSRDVFAPRNIPASAIALANGFGSAIVIALSLLADEVAGIRGLTFAVPGVEGNEDLEDSIESHSASSSGGAAGSCGEVGDSIGEGDFVAFSPGARTLSTPEDPNVDVAEWFAEVNRGNRAAAMTSSSVARREYFSALGGAWRDRVSAMANIAVLLDGGLGDSRSRLLALADECIGSVQTIADAEARLNCGGEVGDCTTLFALAQEHASTASAQAAAEDEAVRARAAVGEARLALIAVSEALDDVESATLSRRAELSGSERLINIRAALSFLVKESADLDVRLGLARARALRMGYRNMFEK